jgi:hypothetical protein
MSQDEKVAWCSYIGTLVGFLVGFWRGTVYVEGLEVLPAYHLDALMVGMQPLGHATVFAVAGWWLFQFWNRIPGLVSVGDELGTRWSGRILLSTESTEPAECV